MHPKVTIGVCARNCERDVKRIIARISSQDFPHADMEVIFVEEGSEDNTLSEIKKYAPRMNINYKLFHQKWVGLGFSRNLILKNADSDYIVWLDDGTIIPKYYVRGLSEFMETKPNIAIARGFIGLYSGTNSISILENMIQLIFSYKYAGKNITKLPATSGSIYRIKAAKQVGGFQEDIQGATEDIDIAYRMLSVGWKIHIVPVQFSIEYSKTFRKVWKKSFWYGYGVHFTLHKHKGLNDLLYKSNPLAGFFEGVLAFPIAYQQTRKKIAILLPSYYFLKRISWYLGIIQSHIDSYGHEKAPAV
jgi:glycosyltransferase involved in cell wall biosynthesis